MATIQANSIIDVVIRWYGSEISGYKQTTLSYWLRNAITQWTPQISLQIATNTPLANFLDAAKTVLHETTNVRVYTVQPIRPVRGQVFYSGGVDGQYPIEEGTIDGTLAANFSNSEQMSLNFIKKSLRGGRRGIGHMYLFTQQPNGIKNDIIDWDFLSNPALASNITAAITSDITIDGGVTLTPIIKPGTGVPTEDDVLAVIERSPYVTMMDTRRRDRGA